MWDFGSETLGRSTILGAIFLPARFGKSPADSWMEEIGMVELSKIMEKERGLLQRKAKLEADIARLRTKEKDVARRDDTRRKIVLGGMILAAVAAGDVPADFVKRLVRIHVADRDKKLFVASPFEVEDVATESTAADVPDAVARE
ncbi:hypothetical protein [Aminobacter sp. AP02]|uniref:hypothetical protein n=1 Tax=Aminobacter sp. AP02 TaxID=2135737 RepID=UPI0018EE5198|nr:hypothetical protein [Aminobacter sp. AP02]